MTLETALAEIKKFWKEDTLPFGLTDNSVHLEKLEKEFSISLPESLKDYVKNFAPTEDVYFDTIGNPMRIYGLKDLRYVQEGYNYNPIEKAKIEDWNESFFIFADEGADPVLLDLETPEEGIQKLLHGQGSWDIGDPIADTIGQFLLCSAAQHHAINAFEEDPIVDDENGYNLSEKAAKWYFPNMKKWAGDYYEEWCSIFDNY